MLLDRGDAGTVTKGSGKHTQTHTHVRACCQQQKHMQLMEHRSWDDLWGEIDDNGWLNGGPADIYIHTVGGHNEGEAVAAGGHIQG